MGSKEKRREQIKKHIMNNIDFLANNLADNKDLELRNSKDGIAVYAISKRKCCGLSLTDSK